MGSLLDGRVGDAVGLTRDLSAIVPQKSQQPQYIDPPRRMPWALSTVSFCPCHGKRVFWGGFKPIVRL
jgi:hypothetical protein